MAIPLSLLVNINVFFGENKPIPQDDYDYIQKYGDKMERGEIAAVPEREVLDWSVYCWYCIAVVYRNLLNASPFQGQVPLNELQSIIANTILKTLGILPNEENLGEFWRNVQFTPTGGIGWPRPKPLPKVSDYSFTPSAPAAKDIPSAPTASSNYPLGNKQQAVGDEKPSWWRKLFRR